MKLYLENLLPRLKKFSQDLDRKEFFIEIPWITIDDNNNQHKYIFQRNGDLIMSSNGQVNIGKWEYLSTAKSLLIDRITDKILLNQYFIDSAIMVLKLDGQLSNLILANELIIPDFKVEEYLKRVYYEKYNIKSIELKGGLFLEISDFKGYIADSKVSIDGERVTDGVFQDANHDIKYEIVNSKVKRILIDMHYKTDKGDLIVEQQQFYKACPGDKVRLNNSLAPDGKYKLGFMNNIYVKNGEIVLKKQFLKTI